MADGFEKSLRIIYFESERN